MIQSFDCILPDEPPIVLILGSLPSVSSIGQQQYYAHPQNSFWRIIEALFANGAPCTYAQRIELLKHNRIALWDVIASAKREGSLDSAIEPETIIPNDIISLLNAYPSIKTIYLNGGTAATLFKRHIAKQLSGTVQIIPLPSTSPANARMGFQEKFEKWGVIKSDL
jgi:hypoxanthine-DNA glycosylase